MQKKIIALAVAGLVSGAAFAQSNVSMYGFIDMAYIVANQNINPATKTYSAVNAGGINGNRIGFRGEEDLGDGLSAKFNIAIAFQGDTGMAGRGYAGTSPLTRWSTVSLASKSLGEIEAGRRDTFQDQFLGDISADARTMASQVSNVYLDNATYGNFVAYLSPVWSGFQVKAGVSTASPDNAQEIALSPITATSTSQAANSNNRVGALAALYNNGPLKLGVSYEYNKLQSRDSNVAGVDGNYKAGNSWDIGGAYDFGVVRIDGAYGRIKYAQNLGLVDAKGVAAGETRDSRKQWTLGLSAPVSSNGIVSLVYAHAKVDYNYATHSDTLSLLGLAYRHNLSKRTTLYAAYGKINMDDDIHKVAIASISGTPSGSAGYQQAFQVGVKHAF